MALLKKNVSKNNRKEKNVFLLKILYIDEKVLFKKTTILVKKKTLKCELIP